jgi:hypothetical protein
MEKIEIINKINEALAWDLWIWSLLSKACSALKLKHTKSQVY